MTEDSQPHVYLGTTHRLAEPFLTKESKRPLRSLPSCGQAFPKAACGVAGLAPQLHVPVKVHRDGAGFTDFWARCL